MNNQATILPMPKKPLQATEKILLTAEEKIIVDLISTAIIKQTFNHEKRSKVSSL